jgi:hypothetical protein
MKTIESSRFQISVWKDPYSGVVVDYELNEASTRDASHRNREAEHSSTSLERYSTIISLEIRCVNQGDGVKQ